MAEESKIDADYVHMGNKSGGTRPGTGTQHSNTLFKAPEGLDDPNLSQEEKDLRLAIALQQQENASMQASNKNKIKAEAKSNMFRTGRSGAATGLAAMRKKDGGALRVPPEYNNDNAYKSGTGGSNNNGGYKAPAPGASDAEYAAYIQQVDSNASQTGAEAEKMMRKEQAIDEARKHRSERSGVPTRPGAIKK
jgi:hypothetical protein